MDNIRVIQPYRLWNRFLSSLGKTKYFIFLALGWIFFQIVIELRKTTSVFLYILFGVIFLLIFLRTVYNPFRHYYKPRPKLHAFDYNKFVLYFYRYFAVMAVVVGYIIGLFLWCFFPMSDEQFSDNDWFLPPFFASLIGGITIFLYLVSGIKEEKIRAENHQDIDYNVKVDLNDIYGINDKLVLCYQNFRFNQKQLNAGDYMLGLSAKSFYFVIKQEKTEKFVVNFEDLTAIGSLSLYGFSLLHFESKDQIEIDLLMKQEASLVVSCTTLIQKMWCTLDNYIINNGNVSGTIGQSRRRITISNEKDDSYTDNKMSIPSGNRVIDISYSGGVISEIRNANLIESNRVIEI